MGKGYIAISVSSLSMNITSPLTDMDLDLFGFIIVYSYSAGTKSLLEHDKFVHQCRVICSAALISLVRTKEGRRPLATNEQQPPAADTISNVVRLIVR